MLQVPLQFPRHSLNVSVPIMAQIKGHCRRCCLCTSPWSSTSSIPSREPCRSCFPEQLVRAIEHKLPAFTWSQARVR